MKGFNVLIRVIVIGPYPAIFSVFCATFQAEITSAVGKLYDRQIDLSAKVNSFI